MTASKGLSFFLIAAFAFAIGVGATILVQSAHAPSNRAPQYHVHSSKKKMSAPLLWPSWSVRAPYDAKQYPISEAEDARVIALTKGSYDVGKATQRIQTLGGSAEVTSGCAVASETYCSSLVINHERVLEDATVTIVLGYPADSVPSLLLVTSATGGNACCWSTYLVDVTGKRPEVFKDLHVTGKMSISPFIPGLVLISGTHDTETDQNGDMINVTFIYDTTKKKLIAAPYDHHTDFTKCIGRYSNDVLSDDGFRKPFVATLKENFKPFREVISTESPLTWAENRFLVGQGGRYGDGGLYIFDTATGQVAAYWYTERLGMQSVGQTPSSDTVQSIIAEWKKQIGQ